MTAQQIDISSIGQIPHITSDYLLGKPELRPFYSLPPVFDSVDEAIEKRKRSPVNRNLLVHVLEEQYKQSGIDLNEYEKVKSAITALQNESAFTVTTGHQLCLFTGPLYFVYKILSAIKLATELNSYYKKRGGANPLFIPVYWMVSEDHDFAEVNHVHVFGKKIEWRVAGNKNISLPITPKSPEGDLNSPPSGGRGVNIINTSPSGTIRTDGILRAIDELSAILGDSPGKNEIIQLFTEAYSRKSLTDTTRWLVNRLFGEYGLVIIDGNDARLKKSFIPVMEEDIFQQTPFHCITKTNEMLKKMNYEQQVNPREINCFYIFSSSGLAKAAPSSDYLGNLSCHDNPAKMQSSLNQLIRKRIVKDGELYRILQTDITFSKPQLTRELHDHPERFSPNVVLRPLYQETILPNIAYIGGSNELAYWLQLKGTFDHFKINYPIPVLRNSALWIDSFADGKMNKLNIRPEEIFQPEDALIKKYVHAQKDDGTVIQDEKSKISSAFDSLASKGSAVDITLRQYIEAEKQKAIKSLDNIEEKIFRAEKRKNDTAVEQIKNLKKKLFPPDGAQWQERHENFTVYYVKHGSKWFDLLLEKFICFGGKMNIFVEGLP